MPAKPRANPIAVAFGAELRAARLAVPLTQQVLAERAEVDPVFISFLENGHRQPSLRVILSLERTLDFDPGELSRRVAKRLAGEAARTPAKRARNSK